MRYEVKWESEEIADSHEEAARQALKSIVDFNATYFVVSDGVTSEEINASEVM